MEASRVFLIKVHAEELLNTTHAIKQWLRDNQPVRAYEALTQLDRKIEKAVEELEEMYEEIKPDD